MAAQTYPPGMSGFNPAAYLFGVPYMARDSRAVFVAPAYGKDGNSGANPDEALATLYKAHSIMRAGKNDVCFLIGDGGTTGTARLSKALAQSVDPAATSGALLWSKNACHLIGITAPAYNQRARIAPPTGVYTQSTFGSGTFVLVSGSGCHFENVALFHGFSTGGASQVCWRDTGSRNYYRRMWFGGMGDQDAADDAGSRDLLLEGSESVFEDCVVGLDTVTRGAANASVEFKTTSSKRHTFRRCLFPFMCDASSPLGIKVATAAHSDRWQYFERCKFINAIGSTSTAMAALATLAASIGGHVLLEDCVRHGITEWGTDATSRAQMYVLAGGETPNGHTAGESVVTSTS